jgi:hypothetical protein
MKKLITFAVILLLVACKSETKKDETVQVETEMVSQIETSKKPMEKEEKNYGNFLCKINGKDWSYTKASGIVSRHKKTKKRTAIITFTKQLEKGKETVQLYYDGDTNELEKASVHLKQVKKDGGKMTAMYQLQLKGGTRLPESEISGTLDLSKPTASGSAEVTKMKIRFDEGNLDDKSVSVISITPFNFSGIGYSDAEKLFGSKND